MTTIFNGPILYVEDEEDDVILVRIAFKRAGIVLPLQVAVDGREALEYLFGNGRFSDRQSHPLPSLLLLDLNLPQLNGLEVLQRIRQEPRFNELPVIIFSSSEQVSDQEKARELGATDYVVKPSNFELLARFAQTLKERWLPHCPSKESGSVPG
jgi:CheY-like chemotaxis protein